MIQRTIYTVVIYLLLISGVRSQQIIDPVYQAPYKFYGIKDGLSQGQAHKVFQDSNGFVWVANKEGVDRFDGLEFINFKTDSTFIEDYVGHIREDKNGVVWFSGRKGAYKYEEGLFDFFPWEFQYSTSSIIFENGGVGFKTNGCDDTYYFIQDDELKEKSFIFSLINEQRDFGTTLQLNSDSDYFSLSFLKEKTIKFRELHVISKGVATLLAEDSIIQYISYTPDMKKAPHFRIGHDFYEYSNDSLHQISSHSILSPIQILLQKNGQWLLLKRPSIYIQNQSGDYISIFKVKDISGQIANGEDGIYMPTQKGLVHLYTDHALSHYPIEKGMLSTVWGILEDDNEVMWFNSFSQKKLLQLNKDKYREVNFGNDFEYKFYPGALKTISGDLWFSTAPVIVIIDKQGQQHRLVSIDINDLFEDEKKIYGAGKGLYVYQDRKIVRHYSDTDGLDMKRLGYIEVIEKDTSGLFWLGSHLGLATWDGNQFKNYYLKKDIPAGIMSIKKDYRGNLWFGTHKGVSFYDYNNELPEPVAPKKFNMSVKFIEFIDSSYVLMGGSGELYLLDLPAFYRGEFDLYTITEEDGFIAEECLQNGSCKDSKGHIWVGTSNGVVKLDPSKLKLHKEPTEPHFSYVSFHQASTEKEILHRIPFGQNDFSFSATSSDRNIEIKYFTINHHKAKSITYRHRLKGYEDNWSLPRSPRFVSYSNLPVGDYEFELQTCLGERCTKTKSLHFDIQPSIWHEYALVRGGVALLLGFLFYTLYRQRQQNRLAKRQSEKLEKEKTEMELKQLKMRKNLAMHKVNPHFTFNVLNAISDLIMRQEKEAALQYTAKFGNLFRPLLANEGKLFRSLREEIQFVEDYLKLEQLRFPEKFEYEIQIDDTVNQAVNVPIMVIQSFVNNAIKHGMEPLDSDGLVQIEASQAEDIITVVISDNGIGRKESEKQSGKYNTGEGIKIAEEIIQYLNEFSPKKSSIQIEELNPYNKEYPGTKVILKLYAKYEEKI